MPCVPCCVLTVTGTERRRQTWTRCLQRTSHVTCALRCLSSPTSAARAAAKRLPAATQTDAGCVLHIHLKKHRFNTTQAYCACELSTRELRLSVSDHDLLAAMAALWLALPLEARSVALEELAPRPPRQKAKRKEEEGHTEPSSCTRDSEWDVEEHEVLSGAQDGKRARVESSV